MIIPKNLQEKRDKLAIEFQNAIWRLELHNDFFDEGMCFKRGFHSAFNLLLPEIEKISETLSTIATNDPDEVTSYQVNQTLKSLREFLGEESEGGDE